MKLYLPDGNGGYKEVEMESETCVINIENIIEDQTPPYELPTMNETLKGGAAVGSGLFMLGDTLNAQPLLTMTEAIKGGAKVGTGLYMSGDILNAEPLPTMTENLKGGAKVGDGLYMNGDVLNVKFSERFFLDDDGALTFEPFSGFPPLGAGLGFEDGVLTIDPLAVLPTLGNGFSIVDGELNFDPLAVIPLGDGLTLSSDGALTFDPVSGFPSLGAGLGFGDGVLTIDPFEVLPTLGNGFSIVDGELNFNPLAVISLSAGLTLSADGALTFDPSSIDPSAFSSGGGDTVVVENPYKLPTMSETLKGGAKVGAGLCMTDETLNVDMDGLFDSIMSTQSERAQAASSTTNVNWGNGEVYDSQHRRIGTASPPLPPADWRDENPPLTIAIPEAEPPFCVAYGKSTWGGGGLLILSEEWYYRDFKLYGDDDKELFTTNEQTYVSGWFPGDISDLQVDIVGDERVLSDEEDIIESETNIAETKALINGQTIIRITRYTFRHYLQKSRITAKWHSKEALSFVCFAGSVHAELPPVDSRGSIIYVINKKKFYLYDGEKWLLM